MTVQDQIKLARQEAFFRPVMVKALNKACELLLGIYQQSSAITLKMHVKDYAFALNFSKSCIVSDQIFNSCISNLLDDATYIDPEVDPDGATDALFNTIKDDYMASFIQGGASDFPSWIERIAGYALGDEEAIEVIT